MNRKLCFSYCGTVTKNLFHVYSQAQFNRNSKLHASLQISSSYSLKYHPISKRFQRLKWLNVSAQIKDIDDNECWSERIYIILLCVFLVGGYIQVVCTHGHGNSLYAFIVFIQQGCQRLYQPVSATPSAPSNQCKLFLLDCIRPR